MRYKLKEAPQKPVAESECRHYWIIEGAGGSTSRGVCKFCGAKKEFHNSWPDSPYQVRDARIFELPDLLETEPDDEPDDSNSRQKDTEGAD